MSTTYIDKLAWLDFKDGKVLMTRSHGKDAWYCAGGKREEGETDEQALLREIQEELSVLLDNGSLTYYGQFECEAHGQPKGTLLRLTCYLGSYQGTLSASSEIAEFDYLPYSKRDEMTLAGKLVFDDLKEKGHIH